MPERGTGFHKHQELISRMRDADPEHASGWDDLGDFAAFLERRHRISKTARDPFDESVNPSENGVIKFKYFDFDIEGHSVVVGGERVHLTKINFDLLNYLALRKNKAVGRIELVEKVWEGEDFASLNTVNVHICKLRKILRAGREDIPEIIRTVRGVGYMLFDEEAGSNLPKQD